MVDTVEKLQEALEKVTKMYEESVEFNDRSMDVIKQMGSRIKKLEDAFLLVWNKRDKEAPINCKELAVFPNALIPINDILPAVNEVMYILGRSNQPMLATDIIDQISNKTYNYLVREGLIRSENRLVELDREIERQKKGKAGVSKSVLTARKNEMVKVNQACGYFMKALTKNFADIAIIRKNNKGSILYGLE